MRLSCYYLDFWTHSRRTARDLPHNGGLHVHTGNLYTMPGSDGANELIAALSGALGGTLAAAALAPPAVVLPGAKKPPPPTVPENITSQLPAYSYHPAAPMFFDSPLAGLTREDLHLGAVLVAAPPPAPMAGRLARCS